MYKKKVRLILTNEILRKSKESKKECTQTKVKSNVKVVFDANPDISPYSLRRTMTSSVVENRGRQSRSRLAQHTKSKPKIK